MEEESLKAEGGRRKAEGGRREADGGVDLVFGIWYSGFGGGAISTRTNAGLTRILIWDLGWDIYFDFLS